MLYKFKSKATGDLIMLEPNGRRMLEIVGKEPGPKGIILAQDMPGAIAALEALSPDDVNRWGARTFDIEIYQPVDVDQATTSRWGPRTMAFTPETFLLSYALPNFYFHAVTAYNILRTRGVPLGKYHFQGQLRIRTD